MGWRRLSRGRRFCRLLYSCCFDRAKEHIFLTFQIALPLSVFAGFLLLELGLSFFLLSFFIFRALLFSFFGLSLFFFSRLYFCICFSSQPFLFLQFESGYGC